MAQVILVTSGRGGAGKSTVCAYLGAALAACGKKVLLIEGSHRSLDVLLGAQDRVVFDLADALERRCELGEAMVDACGVRLLCAPLDLQPIIDGAACRELRAALEEHFDFILIEVDGGINAQTARQVIDAGANVLVAGSAVYFVKLRPIPDLDWLIDQVCAQLIAVLPFDEGLVTPVAIGQNINLSNVSKIIFDNFAQRILGNYIDLLVQ